MSLDIGAALRIQLAKPEVRAKIYASELDVVKIIELIEDIGLRTIETVLEDVFPPVVRPLVVALAGPLLDRGIVAIEKLTDEEARRLLPVHGTAEIGAQTFSLTVAKVWPKELPTGPEETVGDWPTERNKE